MSPKKKQARRRPRRQAPVQKLSCSAPSSQPIGAARRLEELAETLDIMVPELSARVAAIEHLLVQKKICTRDDLIRSREFVDSRRA